MAKDMTLWDFFRERFGHGDFTELTRLSDVLDSLSFIDFFLYLEEAYGLSISLDDVVSCETLGQLADLVNSPVPRHLG